VLWLYNEELQERYNETLSAVIDEVYSKKRENALIVFT
jgi:hypothetical protein